MKYKSCNRHLNILSIFILFFFSYSFGVEINLKLSEISQTADLIFVGRCIGKYCRYDEIHQMIFTDVYFKKQQIINAKENSLQRGQDEIILTFAGGEIDKRRIVIGGTPDIQLDQLYILFAFDNGKIYANPLIGGAQGIFKILNDAATKMQYVFSCSDRGIMGFRDDRPYIGRDQIERIENSKISFREKNSVEIRIPNSDKHKLSTRVLASYQEINENLPLSLDNFVEYIKTVALEAPLLEKRIRINEKGSFYFSDNNIVPIKLNGFSGFRQGGLSPKNTENARINKNGFKTNPDFAISAGTVPTSCGFQWLPIVMEQIASDHWSWDVFSWCMQTWNYFMPIYWNTPRVEGFGVNGINEIVGWLDDENLYDTYGFDWGTAPNIGLAVTIPQGGLLCGVINEADIAFNAAYFWTNNEDIAFGSPDVLLLRPIAMHELGHAWGEALDWLPWNHEIYD